MGVDLDDAPKRPVTRKTLVRIIGLYRPYVRSLIFVAFLIVFGAALLVASPLLIRQIIDVAIPSGDRSQLIQLSSWMIGLALLGGVMSFGTSYLNARTGLTVMEDLRLAVYSHLQKLPFSFFTSTRTGDLQTRISSDVAGTQTLLTDTVSVLVGNSVNVTSASVAMLIISWELSLVALVTIPLFTVAMVRVGKKRRELTRETQRTLSDLTARTGETLSVSGVMLSKTFGRETDQLDKFKNNSSDLTRITLKTVITGQRFSAVMQTFFNVTPAIIWLLGGIFITNARESVTLGDVVAFTAIQARMLFPLAGLFMRGIEISSSIALFDRIFEYLDIDPKIKDPAQPVAVDPARFRGDIEYRNVGFMYSEAEASKNRNGNRTKGYFTLQEIDFRVSSGALTALVGPSGAGKTSVGYLLARLYDVDSGAITIDGIDVKEMTQADLSRLIGVVSQDPFMFHASIKDNLQFGKPDATEEEMIEVTRAAQIYNLIDGLPE
ncbi:MAG TPA: hypothetical protein DHV68_03425, partial [Dehalococcoidia bacterium]|nr:hypothetical protein [Dehalococcoidia bacterium]